MATLTKRKIWAGCSVSSQPVTNVSEAVVIKFLSALILYWLPRQLRLSVFAISPVFRGKAKLTDWLWPGGGA